MIPRFLRPEVFPFASLKFVAAAAGLPVPAPVAPVAHQEDVDDDAREEICGSTCGAACGYCGRCS